MTEPELRAHLAATGWTLQQGRYVREVPLKTPTGVYRRFCRIQFNKLSLKIELQSSNGTGWFRIGGAPYATIRKNPTDNSILVGSFKVI